MNYFHTALPKSNVFVTHVLTGGFSPTATVRDICGEGLGSMVKRNHPVMIFEKELIASYS